MASGVRPPLGNLRTHPIAGSAGLAHLEETPTVAARTGISEQNVSLTPVTHRTASKTPRGANFHLSQAGLNEDFVPCPESRGRLRAGKEQFSLTLSYRGAAPKATRVDSSPLKRSETVKPCS